MIGKDTLYQVDMWSKENLLFDAVVREVKEESGLTIKNPILCGVKQFPIEGGRYIVFLYKTNEFEGDVISSEEGKMVWIEREDLISIPLVKDFIELLEVFDKENLSEFQYVVNEDMWDVKLK